MLENDTTAVQRKVVRRCEQLGENATREKLATGFFADEWQPHVRVWLAHKDHERVLGEAADAKRTASSAKTAAWTAAIAAIVAAIAAIVSAVIAYHQPPA